MDAEVSVHKRSKHHSCNEETNDYTINYVGFCKTI